VIGEAVAQGSQRAAERVSCSAAVGSCSKGLRKIWALKSNSITRLAADKRVHSARLWLYCRTTGENPAFELSHAALASLGRSGVTLAIDFYVLDSEDD
jgi:hypothetical protein